MLKQESIQKLFDWALKDNLRSAKVEIKFGDFQAYVYDGKIDEIIMVCDDSQCDNIDEVMNEKKEEKERKMYEALRERFHDKPNIDLVRE